jgi:putative Ca2+/H+ antiporter (TMEM165/GDT1 family)
MDAFLLSFGVIFLAELGDKSQLMALAFAARYRPWIVLLAVAIGSLALFGVSVVVGRVVGLALPTNVISVIAGVVFLAFAVWTLRARDDDEMGTNRSASSVVGALVTVVSAFVLAELGDKTMIATVTLATTHEPIGTWLGAVGGEVSADAIAISIGAFLGARLPERAIKIFAAGAFLVFGLILIGEGVGIL